MDGGWVVATWFGCLRSAGSTGDMCIADPRTMDTPESVGTIRTSPGAVRLGGGGGSSWRGIHHVVLEIDRWH